MQGKRETVRQWLEDAVRKCASKMFKPDFGAGEGGKGSADGFQPIGEFRLQCIFDRPLVACCNIECLSQEIGIKPIRLDTNEFEFRGTRDGQAFILLVRSVIPQTVKA